ncbi:hypothetical protein C8R45DRAFT_1212081 [Mycena sanguinolenta]|nr:hypothetical protein C8R45DRAFT_1212081 [Mycena sanguinolenta]
MLAHALVSSLVVHAFAFLSFLVVPVAAHLFANGTRPPIRALPPFSQPMTEHVYHDRTTAKEPLFPGLGFLRVSVRAKQCELKRPADITAMATGTIDTAFHRFPRIRRPRTSFAVHEGPSSEHASEIFGGIISRPVPAPANYPMLNQGYQLPQASQGYQYMPNYPSTQPQMGAYTPDNNGYPPSYEQMSYYGDMSMPGYGKGGIWAGNDQAHGAQSRADVVGTIDTHVDSDGRGTAPARPASPSYSTSSHASSVEGFGLYDQVLAHIEDVEQKAEDALDMSHVLDQGLKDLGRRVEAPFTIAQLSALAQRIDSDKTEQSKINCAHDATVAALQDDIRQLQATVARLEIRTRAPLTPRASDPRTHSPTRRVSPLPRHLRSRSRSPAEPRADFKRSRPELAESRMGPISMHLSMASRDSFHTYLDSPNPGNYIIVEWVSMENARALARAWNAHTVAGYKDIKMEIHEESRIRGTTNVTASSSYRRQSAAH